MQQSSKNQAMRFHELNISYLIGSADILEEMPKLPVMEPFSEKIVGFISNVSKYLLADEDAKKYKDVVTLAFWMRRASIESLKKRFRKEEKGQYRIGLGVVYTIAPSNVPVNYAYSLVVGVLCGNTNIVRVPTKEFEQVNVINKAIRQALEEEPSLKPYIVLVKYGHEKRINDAFSAIANLRVIWGGDATIDELRQSRMMPRSTEITFSDRYSLAVIDSDAYMKVEKKGNIAKDFYNDTYLTDQNACTSPRVVIWMGSHIQEAKEVFWKELHYIVIDEYQLQGIQAIKKLTSCYLLAAIREHVKRVAGLDNYIIRMQVDQISAGLMELKESCGYFFEYDCSDIMEMRDICNDLRCQTISYLGQKEMFLPLLKSGVHGIDRIVPMGKTMDFDLLWDGYNLFDRMTRCIVLE